MPERIPASTGEFGLLAVKAVLKIFIVILVSIQFIPGMSFFGNWWIVLGILFFAYFQMPMGYSTNEPYKAFEAWFRWIVGLVIAIVLLIALSPSVDFGQGLAFFVVLIICVVIAVLFSYGFKIGGGIAGFVIMTGVMYIIFSFTDLGTGLPQAAPIFFLTLAFFFVAPERKESEEEKFYWER